jgi:hypothetical protein
MGREINHEHRYTDEEREYLESRGQSYRIVQNERIYGKPGDEAEPEEPGRNPDSENAKKLIEEQRAANEEQAKSVIGKPYVDPAPTVTTGDDQLKAVDSVDDALGDESIDPDIVSYVDGMTIAQLKKALDDEEPPIKYKASAKHDELAEDYANVLQDKRDAGETLELDSDDEDDEDDEDDSKG